MKIDQNIKDRINAAAFQILEHYGVKQTNRSESQFIGLCPFHPDKNPSFTLRFDAAGVPYWKCQACGKAGGDIFSFVAEMEGLDPRRDFPRVAERAAQAAGLLTLDATDHRPAPQMPPLKRPAPAKPFDYITPRVMAYVEQRRATSALYKVLYHTFGQELTDLAFSLYQAGAYSPAEALNKYQNHYYTAFPLIDQTGRVVDVKLIKYLSTGKRARNEPYSVAWVANYQNLNRAPVPLFGEHLLKTDPAKPVGIVESEKTAIIATICAPQYIWIATGGKALLNADRCKALKGRVCFAFPDGKGLDEWEQRAAALNKRGFNITSCADFIRAHKSEEFDADYDLADILLKAYENGE